jgi:hypothetical protein
VHKTRKEGRKEVSERKKKKKKEDNSNVARLTAMPPQLISAR